MAFVVTETKLELNPAGTAGKAILFGTYASNGGSTGGQIKPGVSAASPISGSRGLRKIYYADLTSTSASPSEPQIVVSFDATQGGDIVTVTTAADQTGTFRLEGEYAGA